MGDLLISKTRIIKLPCEKNLITPSLLTQMRAIVSHSYCLSEDFDFHQRFIGREETEVALFYGEYGDLAGFSTTKMKHFSIQHKKHAIYQGQVFFDKPYLGNPAAAKFGFTHAMKYKLSHPDYILAHVAEISTPLEFSLYAKNVHTFYPKPDARVPDHVKSILKEIKIQRELTTQEHPLVVRHKEPLILKPKRLYKDKDYIQDERLVEFYTTLNPDYALGNNLLIYVPLDISNICQGVRHVLEQGQLTLAT